MKEARTSVTVVLDGVEVGMSPRDLRRVVRAALGGTRAAVTLLVTGDRRISDLCARFLGRPRKTDVLAFPDSRQPPAFSLGEVAVNVERARREAGRRGIDPSAELALYVVHGVLHLIGYNDLTAADARRMRAREAEVLERLGYPPVFAAPVKRSKRR
jgi:probable rRNA maturation factor